MKRLPLPDGHTSTTQLGFGCSSLMGAIGRRESLALLEHAYAAGIRHFDVAPMYGYGAAEGCLGEFLARHRGDVTVTTKFGIAPPSNQGLLRTARRLLNPALKLLPAVKRRLASAASSVASTAPKAAFTVAEANASLDRSLAELRTDHIDFWLLHEAEAKDLSDDALLRFVQDALAAGKIGAFGCGSSADKVPTLLAHKPAYCKVLQFEWSVLDKPLDPLGAFTIHHRALTANFSDLLAALRRDPAMAHRWSIEVGMDLTAPGRLACLMLKAALVLQPQSLLLVSSRNPAHIEDNVRTAIDDSLVEPARRLYMLAQREAASVMVRA